MKFQILQYWADMIMYNSYMKEMKYVQVMNLGAFAKAKSVSQSDFLTYSRETWFLFSYEKVVDLHWPIEATNEVDRVNKFNNSLSFCARQSAL